MRWMRPLIIYHARCADGFGAAWSFRHRFGTAVDFHAASHGDLPPEAHGRIVVIVDFSYKRAVLRALAQVADMVLVLDHHQSAADDLIELPADADGPALRRVDHWLHADPGEDRWARFLDAPRGTVYAAFDQARSGAGIAWDFLHPDLPRPAVLNAVEDRDLWRFALPHTREIQAAVFSHPQEFAVWDLLMGARTPAELEPLITEGRALERSRQREVAELLATSRRRMHIAGHDVPVANLPSIFASDAGAVMAVGEAFAACYWDAADARHFSLRSNVSGIDVSAVAGQFGGGGHRHAAGFKVPRTHALARQ